MNNYLKEVLADSLKRLGVDTIPAIELEVPPQETMGDLSTPVAMSLSKIVKKPPRKIAEEIVSSIQGATAIEKIDIAGPGFINVTFSKGYLFSQLKKLILSPAEFLRKDIGGGKKIQVEYISANPTGPLHLGHGRGGATGEALANLLSAAGFRVEREYYINDAGKQVHLLGLSVFARYQQLLGMEYPFPEEGYRGSYVDDIAKDIINYSDNIYLQARFQDVAGLFIDFAYKRILKGIQEDLKAFGIIFDNWQSERELFRAGDVERSIGELKQKGYVYERDGATWFKATAFGDEKDRVIVKQDGEYTYFTSDIAYHRKKIEKRFDELIDVWGADHHGYIPRVKAVMEALGYPGDKLRVILVQMVSLLRGGKPVQMSKRAGEFVTLSEVIQEVGADTTKFIFLTRRPDSHLEFDLEVAKAQSAENPVFYVQYANARINSIFSHAREKKIESENLSHADFSLLTSPEELRIIKKMLLYPMIFEGAVNTHEPHRITFYLQELSGMFHPFYNKYRVVAENAELSRARLALCHGVRILLREGLGILGIAAPDKM